MSDALRSGASLGVINLESFDTFDVEQPCQTALTLQAQLLHATALKEKLMHGLAAFKRLKFMAKSDMLKAERKNRLEEMIDSDLADLAAQLERGCGGAYRPQPASRIAELLPHRSRQFQLRTLILACDMRFRRTGVAAFDTCRRRLGLQPHAIHADLRQRRLFVKPQKVFPNVGVSNRLARPPIFPTSGRPFKQGFLVVG